MEINDNTEKIERLDSSSIQLMDDVINDDTLTDIQKEIILRNMRSDITKYRNYPAPIDGTYKELKRPKRKFFKRT